MASTNHVAEIKGLLEGSAPESREGDYISFFDEEDPGAGVCLRRKNGALVWLMTTDAYATFMKKAIQQ